jgi:hypothetical protein
MYACTLLQRALRVKEELLLHVAHSLQALVADVSKRSSAEILGRTPAAKPAACAVEDDGNLLWLMAVTTVQQWEHDIEQMYGELMGSLFPGHQQQLHGMELVKSLCRPDFMEKVGVQGLHLNGCGDLWGYACHGTCIADTGSSSGYTVCI